MAVWALGLNHNTAPLDLRGRFAFALDQIAPALTGLRRSFSAEGGADELSLPVRSMPEGHPQVEAAILSTCNRTEIYCAGATEGNSKALAHTLGWLAQTGGVSPTLLQAHTYALHEEAVARHAFRVASGLDSMVLGEPQILGQMKDAVRAAEGAGALGSTLNQLFQRSFSVAKEVRTATDVGAHSISMAAAAVRLAAQLFEDLGEVRILFVGAGEMIELAATHFAARNPRAIVIANRTVERGQALASRFGAQTMHLAELPGRLQEFDVVISCTASTLPIIGLGAVERAVKARKHRPMFMVDLAVPRDIEPEVKALEDVYLYTVDDLAGVVQNGQAQRAAAVAQAEVIIDAGVENFMRWLDQRDPVHGTVGLIQKLNARADEWRAAEIARARRLLARGDDIDSVLESLSRGLTQKMLHGAMAELQGGDTEQRHQAAESVSRIFLRGNR